MTLLDGHLASEEPWAPAPMIREVHYFLCRPLRQRRKRLTFCLSVRGFVRLLICQALADNAFDSLGSARLIICAKLHPLIVSEIKFCEVPL
jgi:hypothetical protein